MVQKMLCASLVVSLVVTGCSLRHPKPPSAIARGGVGTTYSPAGFEEDRTAYKAAMAATPQQLDEARDVRDRIIGRIVAHVEVNYKAYEESLFYNRALFDSGTDILGIAVTTAGTISNGERVKSILAATATALTGTQLSISKNYFREKTTEILVTKMQASRDSVRAQITNNMILPVTKYPVEAALADLVDYYYAGTLQGALLALSQQVGAKAEEARSEAQDADKERVKHYLDSVTPVELSEDERMQRSIAAIRTNRDVEQARRVLAEIGAPPAANATPQEILDALKARHTESENNAELRAKLLKALKITQ